MGKPTSKQPACSSKPKYWTRLRKKRQQEQLDHEKSPHLHLVKKQIKIEVREEDEDLDIVHEIGTESWEVGKEVGDESEEPEEFTENYQDAGIKIQDNLMVENNSMLGQLESNIERFSNAFLIRTKQEILKLKESGTWARNVNRSPLSCHLLESIFSLKE